MSNSEPLFDTQFDNAPSVAHIHYIDVRIKLSSILLLCVRLPTIYVLHRGFCVYVCVCVLSIDGAHQVVLSLSSFMSCIDTWLGSAVETILKELRVRYWHTSVETFY